MRQYKQVLIEGPDCSGKSTLVNCLKNELCWDAKSLHHKDADQFSRYLFEYSSQEKIIFDRGHISESIYSALWRGGNPFSVGESTVLDSIVRMNMITVFALPDVSVLRERYALRNYAQKITISELETSACLFKDYFDCNKIIPAIIYCSKDYWELEYTVKKVSSIVGEAK